MVVCWECETETDHPVLTSLPVSSRRASELPLCLSCYQKHVLPLTADLAGEPARTGATRGAGRESGRLAPADR